MKIFHWSVAGFPKYSWCGKWIETSEDEYIVMGWSSTFPTNPPVEAEECKDCRAAQKNNTIRNPGVED